MGIGAILAGDVAFLVKSTVQCTDVLNHKIALKSGKILHCRLKLCHCDSENTVPQADYNFLAPAK